MLILWVHSILASIAMELDASILFTPEFSHKAHDSVNELKTASIMMMLAIERGSAQKTWESTCWR